MADFATYEYRVRRLDFQREDEERLERELNREGAEGYLLVTTDGHHGIFVKTTEPTPPPPPPRKQAVTGRVSVVASTPKREGAPPMAQLTVDSAGNAKYQFDDDHGDVVGAPRGDGSGIVVTFASDDPSVASLANPVGVAGTDDAGLPEYLAPLTFGVDGSFNLSADVSNASGAPLVDDDGSTPFVQGDAVPVPVAGGQAVTGTASAG